MRKSAATSQPAAPPQTGARQDKPDFPVPVRRARRGIYIPMSPRVATALIGIPLVIFLVQRGGVAFGVVVLLLALLSLHELEVAARDAGTPLVRLIAYPTVLILLLAAAFGRVGTTLQPGATATSVSILGLNLTAVAGWPWFWPFVPVLASFFWAVLRYPTRAKVSLFSLALTLLVILYVGLFAFLPLLRAQGTEWMWMALAGVWAGDTAAYYAGRAFGHTRLTSLSPGKTLEGLLASILASILAGLLVARLAHLQPIDGLVLGTLVGLAAPLGDLSESYWKRELGVKDLGRLLPGHGGILDRCDSLLFAGIVAYLFALWRH